MNEMKVDIIVNESFYGSINLKTDLEKPLTEEEIRKLVIEKLPTLRGKKFNIGIPMRRVYV